MSQGQPRPLDPNALDHTLNMMPWKRDEIETAKLRQFAEQLWLQFCAVPAQEADQWREAVEEQFIINYTDMPEDPREAIKKLIATEVEMALDPTISSAAAALVQAGWSDAHRKAMTALLDFAQTVGGSSSFWDGVWPEHEAAMLSAATKERSAL